MNDIDGNEVHVGDLVRVLSIDGNFLRFGLAENERAQHLAMLNNDFLIDEIVEDGTKASVSIEWMDGEYFSFGGLYMLPDEFRLIKRGNSRA